MTRFEIHTTYDLRYRFSFNFATRFAPAILYGNLHDSYTDCRNEIIVFQKSICSTQNISFTANKYGFRFTIFSRESKPVAFSRFFPSQKLIKKILSIIQNHISNGSVPITSNFKRTAFAA